MAALLDTNIKAAIRSAEADRLSTCLLADRIAQISIDYFRLTCPQSLSSSIKQTVIATIVAQIPNSLLNSNIADAVYSSTLIVLSLGQGTKVVESLKIEQERLYSLANNCGDRIVRDCHAEVLARRGLVAYLYKELEQSKAKSINQFSLFETMNNKLQLKNGIRLHLYTSSQPCGNATMKKWAKSQRPPQYLQLNADEYPDEVHSKIQINSRHTGQVAVLVKRNNHTNNSNEPAVLINSAQYEYPIGTSPTERGEGNIMTCSDKIAKWNALGLQGSLLSQYYVPLYLSTITVGRKFSKVHCERALCCRLQGFCYPCNSTSISTTTNDSSDFIHNVKKSRLDTSSRSSGGMFALVHPVMMSTQVKLDEGAICTAPQNNENITAGANFGESRSLCVWSNGIGMEYNLEVIDGSTGWLTNVDNESENASQLSSYSLGMRYNTIKGESTRDYYLSKSIGDYSLAKNVLISDKTFFAEWIQKSKSK